MVSLEIVVDRPGRTPLRLTPFPNSGRWSTAAVGGFASATFTLPGDPARWKRELPHGSIVRAVFDTAVIWEGELQDVTLQLLGGEQAANITCVGLGAALLGRTSIRRVWLKRDMAWTPWTGGFGTTGPAGIVLGDVNVSTGAFDVSDLTRHGVRISGNGVSQANVNGNGTIFALPIGLSATSLQAAVVVSGANTGAGKMVGNMLYSATGAGGWSGLAATIKTSGVYALTAAGGYLALCFYNEGAGAITPTATDLIDFERISLWGTSTVNPDSGSGLYGSTILNDLIPLVPGLSIGLIETSSDYAIEAIERSVRDSALNIVNEVASYYTREWAVWEGGAFDWTTVNKDEPQWILTIADLAEGSELTSTIDTLAKTVYVLYVDAASQLEAEASSSSASQRNPHVKQGKTSDLLVSPGFPMTTSTSAQLASRIVGDQGGYPIVQGRLVLPATRVIRRATGSSLPAFMIRGGDNIIVSDLPKTDLFAQGRDGETLFHIGATETDLMTGMMTLDVEGQTKRTDVLLARLAAATRVVTG